MVDGVLYMVYGVLFVVADGLCDVYVDDDVDDVDDDHHA